MMTKKEKVNRMSALFDKVFFGEMCAVCYQTHDEFKTDHLYVCNVCWERLSNIDKQYFREQSVHLMPNKTTIRMAIETRKAA